MNVFGSRIAGGLLLRIDRSGIGLAVADDPGTRELGGNAPHPGCLALLLLLLMGRTLERPHLDAAVRSGRSSPPRPLDFLRKADRKKIGE